MATPQGLISRPQSRYTNTTFNRAFIKGQLQQQMKDSLLEKAESTVPDANAIGEKLNEYELHSGDRALIGNIVQSNIKAFNKDYSENPFNAFTKSSKSKLSNISQALNSPQIAGFIERKTSDDAVIKSADDAGLTGNLQVKGNQVKVKTADGNSGWINIDVWQKNKDKYQALTVGKDYLNTAQLGAGKSGAFEVNMTEYSDIISRVRNVFNDVGESSGTRFEGDANILKTINSTSNVGQLNKAFDYLVNNALQPQDMNTLISNELGSKPGISYSEAKMNVMNSLVKLKESNFETDIDIDFDENPSLTAQGTRSAITGSQALNATDRLIVGDQQTDGFSLGATQGNIKDGLSSFQYFTKATNLNGVIDLGATATVEDTDGNKVANREVSKNRAIQQVISTSLNSGNVKYVDGEGNLVTATGDMFANSLLFSNGESSPKLIKHLKDTDGNLASFNDMKLMTQYQKSAAEAARNQAPRPPIPTKLNKYFVDVQGGKQANYVDALTFVNLTKLNDNSTLEGDTADKLYDSNLRIVGDNTDDFLTEQVYKYYNDFSNQDPTNNVDDDIAMTDIIVEIKDMNLFRINLQGDVITPKADLQTQNYFDRQYKVFVPDADLSTNSKMSNRVRSKNLSPFPNNN